MDLDKEKVSFDEFTLEKFKVVERLQNLEIQVARLVSHTESEQGTISRFHADIGRILQETKDLISKHDEIILGDTRPGLVMKVDRLEHTVEEKNKNLHEIWLAILGIFTLLIGELIFYFLTKH